MYRTFKMCGERGLILKNGAVVKLSALAMKMLDFVKFPLDPVCPSSLRYALAKFDSGDVKNAYDELLSVEKQSQKPTLCEEYSVRITTPQNYIPDSAATRNYLIAEYDDKAALNLAAEIVTAHEIDGIIIKCDDVEIFNGVCDFLRTLGVPQKVTLTMGISKSVPLCDAVIDKYKNGVKSVWCDYTGVCGAESEFSKILRHIFLSKTDLDCEFLPVTCAVAGKRVSARINFDNYICEYDAEVIMSGDNSPETARLIAAAATILRKR